MRILLGWAVTTPIARVSRTRPAAWSMPSRSTSPATARSRRGAVEDLRGSGGYDDLVMLRDIRVESHCEHHIAPFLGVAHVAYLPNGRILGISKIARVVEIFAKRLQTQEALTAQIAEAIENALQPRGVAVLIEAEHQCMSMRGVRQPGVKTITTRFTGALEADASYRDRFLQMVHRPRG